MLSQMPSSFTTRFQFVPTCEQSFWGYSQLGTNFDKVVYRKTVVPQNSCLSHSQLVPNSFTGDKEYPKKFMPISFPTRIQLIHNSSQTTKHMASDFNVSTSLLLYLLNLRMSLDASNLPNAESPTANLKTTEALITTKSI